MINILGLEKVIRNLKSVEPQASREGAFVIKETRVRDKNHSCGTVHCVGGWYAVACIDEIDKGEDLDSVFVALGFDDDLTYNNGAELMSRHLGFDSQVDFKGWLRDNPDLWNNKYGHNLFCDERAFDAPGYSGVIKQFEGLLKRLKFKK